MTAQQDKIKRVTGLEVPIGTAEYLMNMARKWRDATHATRRLQRRQKSDSEYWGKAARKGNEEKKKQRLRLRASMAISDASSCANAFFTELHSNNSSVTMADAMKWLIDLTE